MYILPEVIMHYTPPPPPRPPVQLPVDDYDLSDFDMDDEGTGKDEL